MEHCARGDRNKVANFTGPLARARARVFSRGARPKFSSALKSPIVLITLAFREMKSAVGGISHGREGSEASSRRHSDYGRSPCNRAPDAIDIA